MASRAERMIAAAESRRERAIAEGNDRNLAACEAEIKYWKKIRTRVDQAPPLTQSQRDQLTVLLRPATQVSASTRHRRPERNAA